MIRCPSTFTGEGGTRQCAGRWLHAGWHSHDAMQWSDWQRTGGLSWLLRPWVYVQRLRGRL